MKLSYPISPRNQIIYVHSRDPKILYIEYEGGFPFIWVDCDNQAHHYPRRFEVHNFKDGPYLGEGTLIKRINDGPWDIFDCGEGATEEFNKVRWPNKAPMPIVLSWWKED